LLFIDEKTVWEWRDNKQGMSRKQMGDIGDNGGGMRRQQSRVEGKLRENKVTAGGMKRQ
jgi:hypothetical protein